MVQVQSFVASLEREKARQRTYDTMSRKAQAGHVTGGRVFGYDNIDVQGPDSRRSHVIRQINQAEAAVVQRIFELAAAGQGLTTITKTLNADGAIAPRAQRARPTAWAPSSVREVLYRDLYRGIVTWNKTRMRNARGQVQQRARPAGEWFIVPSPQLRIVSDDLWQRVHERLDASRRAYLRGTDGRLWGRPGRWGRVEVSAAGIGPLWLLRGQHVCQEPEPRQAPGELLRLHLFSPAWRLGLRE